MDDFSPEAYERRYREWFAIPHSQRERAVRMAMRMVFKQGCGDNSCEFVKARGMATNGGCRCADYVVSAAMTAANNE